jgi:aquaporin NIP
MRAPSLGKRASAEALGTFALVTGGCGAIVVDHGTGALGHGGVAASFGLVIMVMIAALGHLSGAHFNPAVTLAFAVTRHFPWRDVPSYIAGQLVGAVGGALTLRAFFGLDAALGATAPVGSPLRALGIEALLTAVLMFVIVSVATDTRAVGELAAVAIGGTVALDALWGGPVTGASMNPARSLGPALVAGFWPSHWIYWVGPVSGALLGAILYQVLRAPALPPAEAAITATIAPGSRHE